MDTPTFISVLKDVFLNQYGGFFKNVSLILLGYFIFIWLSTSNSVRKKGWRLAAKLYSAMFDILILFFAFFEVQQLITQTEISAKQPLAAIAILIIISATKRCGDLILDIVE